MNCRRCERELPIGQRKTCPFCGIYLETIITPRGKGTYKPKRPHSKATLLSLLSVGVAVVVMCVFIPVMTRANRTSALASIESSYYEMVSNRAEYDDEEWTMRQASFSAAVANYKRNYPKDLDNIYRIDRYLLMFVGYDPDTMEFIDTTNQDRRNRELISNTRTEIIDLIGFSFTTPDRSGNATITVELENHSGLVISQVRMAFELFDADGNPSNGSASGEKSNQWLVRTDSALRFDQAESYLFHGAWSDRNMADVKLLWMEVEYGPNMSVYLPPYVCETLWGG